MIIFPSHLIVPNVVFAKVLAVNVETAAVGKFHSVIL